jgi:hypothetical protein
VNLACQLKISRIIPRVLSGAGLLPLSSVVCLTSRTIIFTVAMAIKSIIALFLGLVIQLSQVQLGSAAKPVKSCGGDAHSMSCCEGLKSCPCVKESNPDQKPSPLIPVGGDLKCFVLKTSESAELDELISLPTESVVSSGSQQAARSAFAGVGLSVAFCRFVI